MSRRGKCPKCGFSFRLRSTGRMQAHRIYQGTEASACEGVGLPPITSAEALAAHMAEMVEKSWDKDGLTPIERERRLRAFEGHVAKVVQRRSGH